MAGRPNKAGLDYFELDCHMDDKVEMIEAEFGLKGFAVIVKLYQGIYSGFGYYCEWTPDISVLWAYRLGCTRSVEPNCRRGNVGDMFEQGVLSGFPKNLINEIVAASIRRNIFSEELFTKYHILTSSGIQKRYLNATSKREKIELKKEYLLISAGKNRKNVVINSIYDGRNSINSVENSQSKVKKSKVKNNNNMCKAEANALFERVWKLYPLKRGKGQVSETQKLKLLEIGFEELERAITRYNQYVDSVDYLHYQNGSTFFNSGYVDYLDDNYTTEKQRTLKKKNSFNNFQQRGYNYDDLEKQLLSN